MGPDRRAAGFLLAAPAAPDGTLVRLCSRSRGPLRGTARPGPPVDVATCARACRPGEGAPPPPCPRSAGPASDGPDSTSGPLSPPSTHVSSWKHFAGGRDPSADCNGSSSFYWSPVTPPSRPGLCRPGRPGSSLPEPPSPARSDTSLRPPAQPSVSGGRFRVCLPRPPDRRLSVHLGHVVAHRGTTDARQRTDGLLRHARSLTGGAAGEARPCLCRSGRALPETSRRRARPGLQLCREWFKS